MEPNKLVCQDRLRSFYYAPKLDEEDGEYDEEDSEERYGAPASTANLISSLGAHFATSNSEYAVHYPALDLDFPCKLVPSSTPGHFHLYLDKAVPWYAYKRVLEVLADAGLLESGYAAASIRRKQSFLRTRPTKPKKD